MMQTGAPPVNRGQTAVMPEVEGPPPIPMYSRADVIELTNTHERDVQTLRDRMTRDYRLYRLTEHVNRDPVTNEPLKNYATYTSNMPKVFADKIISWLSNAELLIRVPHIEAGSHAPEIDDHKERFAIGLLRQADERLKSLMQPTIRDAQAHHITIRGGYVGGRCLLVRRPDGSTYADITAWDPLHIHWGIGPDGLAWACYKIKKTRAQIRSEYGAGWANRLFPTNSSSTNAEQSGIWTYDFYDGFINQVVTDNETLKPPTLHGSPRVPAYLALVGPAPLLQSEAFSNLIADVGESVFAAVRDIAEKRNDIMSIMLEIVARARRQTVVTESQQGNKTLPDDPFKQGTEIATRTGEKIYTLDLQKMAQESGAYMVAVDGEWQRATLPYSIYGETPFQLSGFAITQLRQATETVLSARLQAMTAIHTQIVNLLYDQFMTGAFEGVKLSGRDSHRQYFSQLIHPEMLQASCDYEVELTSHLPQDDQGKWQMALTAKQTELLADVDILDQVLQLQDSNQAIDKMRTQKAQSGLPEAQLYTLGSAAAERGDMVTANMYRLEYIHLMMQKWGMLPPDGEGGAPAGEGGGQPARPKGALPQVSQEAMKGGPPQPETSNNGPAMVAPNTPRPGARGQSA